MKNFHHLLIRLSLLTIGIFTSCSLFNNPDSEIGNLQTTNFSSYPSIEYPNPEEDYPQTNNENNHIIFPNPPDPLPGKSSISGVLYTSLGNQVIPNMAFFLTPALDNQEVPPIIVGPIESRDIPGSTDHEGYFSMNNISPDEYYFIVDFGTDIFIGSKFERNTNPLLISLIPNEKKSLGIIFIP